MPKLNKINTNIIPYENLSKDDINFPEFCFGLIGRVPLKDQPSELIFVDKKNPKSKICVSKSEFGFPTQFTRDLRITLSRLSFQKNQFKTRKFKVSGSEILREMGIAINGKSINLLRKHLDILTNTRIVFKNSYYDKATKTNFQGEKNISVIQGYEILTKDRKSRDENGELVGNVYWQEQYFNAYLKNASNMIDIDFVLYSRLNGDITKQLYLFLNKRRYNKDIFRISLEVLAFEKLGINISRPIRKVKFDLKKSHEELIRTGFLSEVPNFDKGSDGKWFVEYSFSTNALFSNFNQFPKLQNADNKFLQEIEISKNSNPEITQINPIEILKQQLLKIGLNVSEIGKLIDSYSEAKIQEAIELFETTIENKTKIRNPKLWIFACLKNDFDTTVVVQKKKKIKEAKLIIEVEEKEKAIKKSEDELKIKESIQRKQKVDEWIANNIEEYVEIRQDYITVLQEKGGVMWQQLVKMANKQDKTFAKIITEYPIYSSQLRNSIWEQFCAKK